MTEQECIGWMEYLGNVKLAYDRSQNKRKTACDMAIKALEMISKRDELEDFNTLENYIAEWNKYKVFYSDEPTEELHWMHKLIHYYMVQFKLYRDSKLSPKEVLEMKSAYEQYRALGTVEELRVARDKQEDKKVVFVHPLQLDDGGDYMCPSCETGTVYDAYGQQSHYCHYCGQKLNWEEV